MLAGRTTQVTLHTLLLTHSDRGNQGLCNAEVMIHSEGVAVSSWVFACILCERECVCACAYIGLVFVCLCICAKHADVSMCATCVCVRVCDHVCHALRLNGCNLIAP